MNKYKSSFSSVVLITLPALLFLFLFLEVIFRFIIPAAEKPLAVYDQENRLLRSLESRRVTGTYSMGKLGEVQADWRTNNFGWNSLIDYSTEHTSGGLICIIGDSYIRALQVDVGKDIASQFRKKIKPEFEVYSFGHDGAPLSQYLHVSRYTKRHFRPDVFVYLLVHNDFEESIANFVHKPYFLQIGMTGDKIEEIQPTTQRLYQFLTYSATFRYLFYNLDLASIIFSFKQSPDNYNANTNVKILSTRKDEIQRGTEYLLTKNQAENKGKRTIFMMNAPVNDIYNGKVETSNVLWINQMVADLCKAHNLECIDLTAAFHDDFKARGQSFSFQMDNHWNEYAHNLASTVLFDYLKASTR